MPNRILLVEDDSDISDVIGMNLEYSGYSFVTLDDGQKAAEYLTEDNSFDLAILDIMLPGLDGFALLEHMQKHYIPVLFLTAKSDVGSKIKGLRDGAEDYLAKPFEMLELLVRIEKILGRTGKLNKTLLYDNIAVNVETRTVTLDETPVDLQPMEYDLLLVLLRHKNCTLSRERLLMEIWGFDYMGTTRTVDMHISNLRRKLGLNSAIVTIPKVGYRLVEKLS
ncbi:MAG TPA: response regulator transcription factor [Negativicutes bacterium]|nr:response regulator transcription factor [Negativicutes bacterium]